MRIEKITDDRVKVTISAEELVSFDVSIEKLIGDSKELHTFLFHVMETISQVTDFNPYKGDMTVEAVPNNDGISLVVSRGKTGTTKRSVSLKPRLKLREKRFEVFYFDSFYGVCRALMELNGEDMSETELYQFNDVYCIVSSNRRMSKISFVMSEFASDKSYRKYQAVHVKEHGKLIAYGDDLKCIASGVKKLYE